MSRVARRNNTLFGIALFSIIAAAVFATLTIVDSPTNSITRSSDFFAQVQGTSTPSSVCTDSDAHLGEIGSMAVRGSCIDETGYHFDHTNSSGLQTEFYCGPTLAPSEEQRCQMTARSCSFFGYENTYDGYCGNDTASSTAPGYGYSNPALIDLVIVEAGAVEGAVSYNDTYTPYVTIRNAGQHGVPSTVRITTSICSLTSAGRPSGCTYAYTEGGLDIQESRRLTFPSVRAWQTGGIEYMFFVNWGLTIPESNIHNNELRHTYQIGEPASINVSMPNGLKSYRAGEAVPIVWTSENPKGLVHLKYWKQGTGDGYGYFSNSGGVTSIAHNYPDTGSYDWGIPSSLPPGDYRVGVWIKDLPVYDIAEGTIRVTESSTTARNELAFSRASTPGSGTVDEGAKDVESLGLLIKAHDTASESLVVQSLRLSVLVDDTLSGTFVKDTDGAAKAANIVDKIRLVSNGVTLAESTVGQFGEAQFTNVGFVIPPGNTSKIVVHADFKTGGLGNNNADRVKFDIIDVSADVVSAGQTTDYHSLSTGDTPNFGTSDSGTHVVVRTAQQARDSVKILTMLDPARAPKTDNLLSNSAQKMVAAFRFSTTEGSAVVNKLQLRNRKPSHDRAIHSLILTYPKVGHSNLQQVRVKLENGVAQLSDLGLEIKEGQSSVLQVDAAINPIEPGKAASGDEIQIVLDYNSGFEATTNYGSRITSTGSFDIVANEMIVRKALPTISVSSPAGGHLLSSSSHDLIKVSVRGNSNNNADVALKRLQFYLTMLDVSTTTSVLTVGRDWRIYDVTDLTDNLATGPQAFSDGRGNYMPTLTTGSSNVSGWETLIVEFDTEERVAPGQVKTYVLRTRVANVASSNLGSDTISIKLAFEQRTKPVTGALSRARASSYNKDCVIYVAGECAAHIWSDLSAGEALHSDSVGSSSTDWMNGYKLRTLPSNSVILTQGGSSRSISGVPPVITGNRLPVQESNSTIGDPDPISTRTSSASNDQTVSIAYDEPVKTNSPAPTQEKEGAVEESSTCFLDGSLIKTPDDPKVYIIEDCKRRWIRTLEEFERNGYSFASVQEVSSESVEFHESVDPVEVTVAPVEQQIVVEAPTGTVEPSPAPVPVATDDVQIITPPNPVDAKVVRKRGDFRIFRIIANKFLWIPSPDAFETQGLAWDGVEETDLGVDSLDRAHLIRAIGDPRVYYVTQGGQRRHIPNIATFESYNNKWDDVVDVDPSVVVSYPHARLIKHQDRDEVYVLEAGQRRLLQNEAYAIQQGYDLENVAPVNDIEFNSYPVGQPIN